MIDEHVTEAERRHLDRVWMQLERSARESPRPLSRILRRRETGAVRFHPASANRKLGPVDLVDVGGDRPRPTPRYPFVSSTYASIEATCPNSCAWKRRGCFADAGFTKMAGALMDAAARGRTGLAVVQEEARLVRLAFRGLRVPQDGARGGRDLRLHVGGDVDSARGAKVLGAAARDWRRRGGGAVWSFTHRWSEIPRAAWGPEISVLASVEGTHQFAAARAQGYAPALVVDVFPPGGRSYRAAGLRVIPCPAETSSRTCASCRLCLDRDLFAMGAAIAFEAHGSGAPKMREQLVQLRRK